MPVMPGMQVMPGMPAMPVMPPMHSIAQQMTAGAAPILATAISAANSINSVMRAAIAPPQPPQPPQPQNVTQPQSAAQPSGGGEVIDEESQMDIKETMSLFTPYAPQCAFWYEHPTPLVETSTFDYARTVIDCELLHKNVKYNEALSSAQLDVICLAMSAHLKGLGILIGDGTGVGKGREIAGCILNHTSFHPEATRILVVSASNHLAADFSRDMSDIGCKLPLRSLGDNWKKTDEKITMSKGVLFVSYKLLARSAPKPAGNKKPARQSRSRVDQIVEWLKGDGSGGDNVFIAFDEVHMAKSKTSATNKAVIALQEALPSAKIVYASATAMSSIDHLSAMFRLGLWGPGTAYESFKQFEEKWKNQTRSGLEIVAAELASRGLYISRRLSLKGTEFGVRTCAMTDEQLDLHARLSAWWTELYLLDNVLVGKEGQGKLWGDHLRFFKALLVAFRVDHCVELARCEIEAGNSVVISLIGTGEAAAKRAMDADDTEEEGLVALKHTMETIIKYAIDNFKGASVPSRLYELKSEIDSFDLPQSPLDLLIYKLELLKNENGQNEKVVELTGRQIVYRKDSNDKWVIHNRLKRGEDVKDVNIRGCKLFQSGSARIAITSTAASCGISLHNHIKGPNRRRVHVQMELPWAADQAMQTLGRTMRSSQHNAPQYVQFASPFDAEKRFAQTVAERAERLGAATTADRRGSGSDRAFGSDLLVGPHASDAMYKVFGALSRSSWPKWMQHEQDVDTGAPTEDWADFARGVAQTLKSIGINPESKATQLLGRLLGIEFKKSNNAMRVYEAACMESMYQALSSKSDKSDIGVEDVILGDKSRIIETTEGGLVQIATDIGLTLNDALKKANESPQTKFAFCTRIDKITQRRFNVLAQRLKAHVRITRPNGRVAMMHFADFKGLYKNFKREGGAGAGGSSVSGSEDGADGSDGAEEEVPDEFANAQRCWEAEHKLCLTTCIHGENCKMGKECTFGKRHVNTSLIKMPGALNSLRNYNGPRQIIRLSDESGGADSAYKCVAVRISTSKFTSNELLDEDMMSEARRNKEVEERVKAKKAELLAKMQRLENQKASCSTSTKNVAIDSEDDSDEDEDEEGDDSDGDSDYSESNFVGLKRRRRDLSSDEEFGDKVYDDDEDDEDDSDDSLDI